MSQMWGNSTGGVRYEPRCFCASSRKDGALLAKMETRHLQSPRDTVAHRPRRATRIGAELKSMGQSENTGRCGRRERRRGWPASEKVPVGGQNTGQPAEGLSFQEQRAAWRVRGDGRCSSQNLG